MQELTGVAATYCANCGTLMEGEFCHHCGQSIHSVLKPVHHMLEEAAETILHIDGRIVRTLPPLLLKPGFLTLEYFSGRRIRYLPPFRLMFVLCLLAFFAGHLALGDRWMELGDGAVEIDNRTISQATNQNEVQQALQQQLDGLDRAASVPGLPALARTQLAVARRELRQQALKRRAQLGNQNATLDEPAAAASANAHPFETAAPARGGPVELTFQPPAKIAWLPDFVNAGLARASAHMQANLQAINGHGPTATAARSRLIAGAFAMAPQTMFLMLPLFALLLKMVYLFRRRLYMEHLIVALHSHAFLFFALLLGILVNGLQVWVQPHAHWLASALRWAGVGLIIWVPAYIVWMQKRIYQQGWPMTVLKFLIVSFCYVNLLATALAMTVVLSLTH